jgi:hypothetical protein
MLSVPVMIARLYFWVTMRQLTWSTEQEHGLKVINLTHIKLVFLPAIVTSIAHPLDQGIIAFAKARYQSALLKFLLAEANPPGAKSMDRIYGD